MIWFLKMARVLIPLELSNVVNSIEDWYKCISCHLGDRINLY